MSAPVIWFVIGVVFIATELFSPLFVMLFFGVGAFAASLATALGANLAIALAVFSIVSVACLLILRKALVKIFQGSARPSHTEATDFAYMGKQAVVTRLIETGGIGEINMSGSYWRAVLDAEQLEPLPEGAKALITGHAPDDAITMTVRRA